MVGAAKLQYLIFVASPVGWLPYLCYLASMLRGSLISVTFAVSLAPAFSVVRVLSYLLPGLCSTAVCAMFCCCLLLSVVAALLYVICYRYMKCAVCNTSVALTLNFSAANNQHNIDAEISDILTETSFYKAMVLAQGTISVIDSNGVCWTRIWYHCSLGLSQLVMPEQSACVIQVHIRALSLCGRDQEGLYVGCLQRTRDTCHT